MVSPSGPPGREQADASSSRPAAQTPPKRLGKYELRKKIGAGGMGTVYLAVDTQLKRTVALKLLPKEKAANATLVKRFQSEAQAAAQLKHDNIVMIYEAGQIDGHLFIALEYVEGTDVFKLVSSRGVLPVKRSLDIVKQVARALKHAHACNIVHRDIKPSNLLIQRKGQVKLTDMGLARSIDDETETGITRAGMTVGTVDYMAPEQARDSKAADIRSDIYSLGCTWYHMLTGAPPFNEGSLTNKLYGHATKPRPDPRDKNESIPEGVVELLHRMMARKPADRHQTPNELLEELENVDTRSATSAEKLLATITDAIDSETDDEVEADPTAVAETPPSRQRVGSSKPEKTDQDWKKFAIVGGVFCVFAAVVWWISTRYAGTLDGPGAVVNRGEGEDDDGDDAVGGGDDSADTTQNTTTDSEIGSDDSSPIDDGSTPPSPVSIPPDAEDVATYGGTTDANLLAQIDLGREGEKAFVPPWTLDIVDPGGPAAVAQAAKLPTLSVGRGSDGPSQFADLNSALAAAPASGAVIQLIGQGPFDLFPSQVADGRQIIITGEEESRPVIALQPDPDNPARPVISVAKGSLSLLNLHVAASAERFGRDGPVTLVEVGSGAELVVRGCSVTLLGTRQGATAAFRMSPPLTDLDKADAPEARLLLDQTFVRGNELTVVAAGGGRCDFLAVNCLFASGAAPIARLSGAASQEANPKRSNNTQGAGEPAERILRFMSCTGLVTHTGFEFAPGSDGDRLPLTYVLSLNSLFAAPRVDTPPTFVVLSNWPRNDGRSAGASLFQSLHWSVRNTSCLGFSTLLRLDGDEPLSVGGVARWQNTWGQIVEQSEFLKSPWRGSPADNPAGLSPADIDTTGTSVGNIAATDGGRPGCATLAAIETPAEDIMRRVAALSERPFPPHGILREREPAKVVFVDLTANEDLGRIVSGGQWQDGTLFVVSGFGPRTSSPIRVHGKSLRIEFRQTGAAPLVVSTRPINPNTVSQDGPLADAFIAVSGGGRIEIANANFRIPRSTSRDYPKWLLYAEDGSFVFDNCVLQGPIIGNTRNRGLIRVAQPQGKAVPKMDAGRYEHHGVIRGSFLKGNGKLFQVDIPGRALLVWNSVLVSAGDLFDVHATGTGPDIHGAIDIDHSTLYAKGKFFKVWVEPKGQRMNLPLRLFVQRTVFAPPGGAPTLLSYTAPAAREERQIEWWGEANGYSHVIRRYLDGPAELPGQRDDFDKSWRNIWGTTGCLRPLTGVEAVALIDRLPMPSNIAAANFELHSKSKATGWTIDGKSIGADIATVKQAGPTRSP